MEHLPSLLPYPRMLHGKRAKKSIIVLHLFRSRLETLYTRHLLAISLIRLLLSLDAALSDCGPSGCHAFREQLPFLRSNPTTSVMSWRQTWEQIMFSILVSVIPL